MCGTFLFRTRGGGARVRVSSRSTAWGTAGAQLSDSDAGFIPTTPGKPWEDFEERLLDVAAGVSDDRGWSLADCFNRVDEGGAAGPPLPAAGTADGRKALASQRKRLSESYSLLTTHELDKDHRTHMSQNHFQNGPDAWDYLTMHMREPVTQLQLREQDKAWNALDIFRTLVSRRIPFSSSCRRSRPRIRIAHPPSETLRLSAAKGSSR